MTEIRSPIEMLIDLKGATLSQNPACTTQPGWIFHEQRFA
jgi:hypothetical protein